MRKTSHRHSFIDGLCGCGKRHSGLPSDREAAVGEAVEQALLHGLFPEPVLRRVRSRGGVAVVIRVRA